MNHPLTHQQKLDAHCKKVDELLAEAKSLPWYYVNTKKIILDEVMRLQVTFLKEQLPRMIRDTLLGSSLLDD